MKMGLMVGLAGVLLASSPAAGARAGVVREHQAVFNQLLEGSCARSTTLVVRGGHGGFGFEAVDPGVGGLLAEPVYEPGQQPNYEAVVTAAEEVQTSDGMGLRYSFSAYDSGCGKWGLTEPQLRYSYKTSESIRMQLASTSLRATAAVIPKDVDNPRLRLLGNRVFPLVSCNSTGMATCSGYVSIKTKRPLLFRGRRHRLTLVEHRVFTQIPPMASEHLEMQLWPPSNIRFVSREQEDEYAVDVERAIFRQSVPVEVSVHYRDERHHQRDVSKTLTLRGPQHHANCACIH
jgi:hypothetical protein